MQLKEKTTRHLGLCFITITEVTNPLHFFVEVLYKCIKCSTYLIYALPSSAWLSWLSCLWHSKHMLPTGKLQSALWGTNYAMETLVTWIAADSDANTHCSKGCTMSVSQNRWQREDQLLFLTSLSPWTWAMSIYKLIHTFSKEVKTANADQASPAESPYCRSACRIRSSRAQQ